MSEQHETGPRLRAESGEEVLDAADRVFGVPGGGPDRPAGHRWAERFPRSTRALGVVLVIAAAAVWGGKAAHDADRKDSAAAARGTVLLRLLGGGGSAVPDPTGGTSDALAFVRLTFTVRDDGRVPVSILAADVDDPGVVVLPSDDDANVAPAGRPVLAEVQPAVGAPLLVPAGKAALVTLRARIDCLAPGLPARPGTLTLAIRDADGNVGRAVLPAPPGLSTVVGDYYTVCGASQTSTTPTVAYDGLVGAADASAHSFSYRVTVSSRAGAVQRLQGTPPEQTGIPGLSTSTDLAAPVPLGPGESRAVVVTVHADDCARIGRAVGIGGSDQGSGSATAVGVDALFDQPVLAVTPGDVRFPQAEVAVDPPGSSRFFADFLARLRVACPALG